METTVSASFFSFIQSIGGLRWRDVPLQKNHKSSIQLFKCLRCRISFHLLSANPFQVVEFKSARFEARILRLSAKACKESLLRTVFRRKMTHKKKFNTVTDVGSINLFEIFHFGYGLWGFPRMFSSSLV